MTLTLLPSRNPCPLIFPAAFLSLFPRRRSISDSEKQHHSGVPRGRQGGQPEASGQLWTRYPFAEASAETCTGKQPDSGLKGLAPSGRRRLWAAGLANPPLLGWSLGCRRPSHNQSASCPARAVTQVRTHLLLLRGRVCKLQVLTHW